MSKILVIEPYRMLQQAISTTLFPEHEVQIRESVPDEPRELDPDLVIVDAVSLRTRNLLGSELPGWLQAGRVPLVWVDHEKPPNGAKMGKLIFFLQSPLTKEKLVAAVAEFLKLVSRQEHQGTQGDTTKSGSVNTDAIRDDTQLIELVDIVEEEADLTKSDRGEEK